MTADEGTRILNRSNAGSNEKIWFENLKATNIEFGTYTDAWGPGQTWQKVTRSGTAITQVEFPNGNILLGGASAATPPTAAELLNDLVVRDRLTDHEEFILQPDRMTCGATGASRGGAILAHTVDNSQQS